MEFLVPSWKKLRVTFITIVILITGALLFPSLVLWQPSKLSILFDPLQKSRESVFAPTDEAQDSSSLKKSTHGDGNRTSFDIKTVDDYKGMLDVGNGSLEVLISNEIEDRAKHRVDNVRVFKEDSKRTKRHVKQDLPSNDLESIPWESKLVLQRHDEVQDSSSEEKATSLKDNYALFHSNERVKDSVNSSLQEIAEGNSEKKYSSSSVKSEVFKERLNSKFQSVSEIRRRRLLAQSIDRVKRQAMYVNHDNRQWNWNFNANVSMLQNKTDPQRKRQSRLESQKDFSENQNGRSRKDIETARGESGERHLGLAVAVEGRGPSSSYYDLWNAWDSVGSLLKRLFGERDNIADDNETLASVNSKESTARKDLDVLTTPMNQSTLPENPMNQSTLPENPMNQSTLPENPMNQSTLPENVESSTAVSGISNTRVDTFLETTLVPRTLGDDLDTNRRKLQDQQMKDFQRIALLDEAEKAEHYDGSKDGSENDPFKFLFATTLETEESISYENRRDATTEISPYTTDVATRTTTNINTSEVTDRLLETETTTVERESGSESRFSFGITSTGDFTTVSSLSDEEQSPRESRFIFGFLGFGSSKETDENHVGSGESIRESERASRFLSLPPNVANKRSESEKVNDRTLLSVSEAKDLKFETWSSPTESDHFEEVKDLVFAKPKLRFFTGIFGSGEGRPSREEIGTNGKDKAEKSEPRFLSGFLGLGSGDWRLDRGNDIGGKEEQREYKNSGYVLSGDRKFAKHKMDGQIDLEDEHEKIPFTFFGSGRGIMNQENEGLERKRKLSGEHSDGNQNVKMIETEFELSQFLIPSGNEIGADVRKTKPPEEDGSLRFLGGFFGLFGSGDTERRLDAGDEVLVMDSGTQDENEVNDIIGLNERLKKADRKVNHSQKAEILKLLDSSSEEESEALEESELEREEFVKSLSLRENFDFISEREEIGSNGENSEGLHSTKSRVVAREEKVLGRFWNGLLQFGSGASGVVGRSGSEDGREVTEETTSMTEELLGITGDEDLEGSGVVSDTGQSEQKRSRFLASLFSFGSGGGIAARRDTSSETENELGSAMEMDLFPQSLDEGELLTLHGGSGALKDKDRSLVGGKDEESSGRSPKFFGSIFSLGSGDKEGRNVETEEVKGLMNEETLEFLTASGETWSVNEQSGDAGRDQAQFSHGSGFSEPGSGNVEIVALSSENPDVKEKSLISRTFFTGGSGDDERRLDTALHLESSSGDGSELKIAGSECKDEECQWEESSGSLPLVLSELSTMSDETNTILDEMTTDTASNAFGSTDGTIIGGGEFTSTLQPVLDSSEEITGSSFRSGDRTTDFELGTPTEQSSARHTTESSETEDDFFLRSLDLGKEIGFSESLEVTSRVSGSERTPERTDPILTRKDATEDIRFQSTTVPYEMQGNSKQPFHMWDQEIADQTEDSGSGEVGSGLVETSSLANRTLIEFFHLVASKTDVTTPLGNTEVATDITSEMFTPNREFATDKTEVTDETKTANVSSSVSTESSSSSTFRVSEEAISSFTQTSTVRDSTNHSSLETTPFDNVFDKKGTSLKTIYSTTDFVDAETTTQVKGSLPEWTPSSSDATSTLSPVEETSVRIEPFSKEPSHGPVSTSFPVRTSTTGLPRFCTAAWQCNSTLNERCITSNTSSVCRCGRAFVRHPKNRKCQAKTMLEASLRFPDESYHEELKDSRSDRYKRTKRAAEDTMWLLLQNTPDLLSTVAKVDVVRFSPGSLVVHWNLALAAAENASIASLAQHVDKELKETLKRKDLLINAPLKATNVVLLTISRTLDLCKYPELNFCSKRATCVPNASKRMGFVCKCKDGFADFSPDRKDYPGEVCQVVCPPKYCGDYGTCRVTRDDKTECICDGWFLGSQCKISGVVVIASVSAANIIVVCLVVGIISCIYRRRRRSAQYGNNVPQRFHRTEEFPLDRVGSIRVSDVVATADDAPAQPSHFKFFDSTPLAPLPARALPRIRIIPSSLSDYSYSIDSTFDTTSSMDHSSLRKSQTEQ